MKIVYDEKFIDRFIDIYEYISLDSKSRADKFKKDIKSKIEDLTTFPYKFRKSIYFDDENIRDLIFKGYVITYKIDLDKKEITILGIKKYSKDF